MADMDGATELDLAQRQRERYRRKRNRHEHPERIYIVPQRGLWLHLLSDPLDRLVVGLAQRAAMVGEEIGDLLQRVLILRARWDDLLRSAGSGGTAGDT
jgi:hypothetical protein